MQKQLLIKLPKLNQILNCFLLFKKNILKEKCNTNNSTNNRRINYLFFLVMTQTMKASICLTFLETWVLINLPKKTQPCYCDGYLVFCRDLFTQWAKSWHSTNENEPPDCFLKMKQKQFWAPLIKPTPKYLISCIRCWLDSWGRYTVRNDTQLLSCCHSLISLGSWSNHLPFSCLKKVLANKMVSMAASWNQRFISDMNNRRFTQISLHQNLTLCPVWQ